MEGAFSESDNSVKRTPVRAFGLKPSHLKASRLRALVLRSLLLSGVVLSAACSDPPQSEISENSVPGEDIVGDAIVARTADSEIGLADVEPSVAMQLYDLEMQQYRTLRAATESAVLSRMAASDSPPIAELTLEPPLPPRLRVTPDPSRTRPAYSIDAPAPVSIVIFCNFESPHCARLQVRIDHLLTLYSGFIEVAAHDLILPFHRNAGAAASAARCALEQNRFWTFHDALFAGSGALDRTRLNGAAAVAQLDNQAFNQCLDSNRWIEEVEQDTQLASDLGIDTVPAIFVNGLYAGVEPQIGELIWLIEHELSRLDDGSPLEQPISRVSSSAVRVEAMLHSVEAGQGLVLARSGGEQARPVVVREGEALAPRLLLQKVTGEGLRLVNAGELEFLSWQAATARPAIDPSNGEPVIVTPHVAVPVTLDRSEIITRIASEISQLTDALEPVAMRAGDYRLLRITEVEPDSLYALLGFEAGDVILGVNEQPVHEADNPLWRALERDSEVRVRIMRSGGSAQHFTYRFDD
jgi:protein-disulfide isomerase